ncbi:MAG: hypothetical protein WKF75_00795, partial [Singulisphaera sp.]
AGDGSGAGDNKLSRSEFAIDPKAFARADADADGALDTEELRRYLAGVSPDMDLSVQLSADSSGSATVSVDGADGKPGALPAGVKVKPLTGGDVEIAIGGAAGGPRRRRRPRHGRGKAAFMSQFEVADRDNNGCSRRPS